MRDKVVDKIMIKIKSKYSSKFSDTKLLEIRYGLQGIYTIITKTLGIFLIAFVFGFVKEFLIFNLFYIPLRSVGYGTHANSNLSCWIYSIFLILGIPLLISYLKLSAIVKIILWIICFIAFLLFSPADTKKRPMINKKRKLKFKFAILIISVIYLVLILKFKDLSDLVISAMLLESLLVSPLGYILMGEEIRFSLNDLYIFKLN